jgi:peptidoglycan/LPS O-acetylase OafA/YrhL
MTRKIELDFLRGLAIILVVFFHFNEIIPFGWIGVDLFFVLSGYLISTLLFTEFKKNNSVNIKRFLIRRGFKLYPLFYIFILATVFAKILSGELVSVKLLQYESTFTRNYFGGFWAHTWSLCVEEHFYIAFAFLIYIICNKTKYIYNIKMINSLLILTFIAGAALRMASVLIETKYGENHFYNSWARHAHTHHRIDSLFFGVWIGYNLIFNTVKINAIYEKNRKFLISIAFIFIIISIMFMNNDSFKTTIGFTMLFSAFGIILAAFIIHGSVFQMIKIKWLTKLISFTAFIGCNSYAIYLWHPLIRDYIVNSSCIINHTNTIIQFLIYLILSVVIGYLTTKYIENYFLKIREKIVK